MSQQRSTGLLPALAVAAVITTVLALAACGGSSNDPAPPGTTTAAACASYCTTLMGACTGTPQFADSTACNSHCLRARLDGQEFWSEGTAGATSDDSLACRAYHAGVAVTTSPTVHCLHAGPTGGSICGDLCENYCKLSASLCTAGNAFTFGAGGCLADCAGFTVGPANDAVTGNNVQCRINHLGIIAGGGSADVHCNHARPLPTAICVTL